MPSPIAHASMGYLIYRIVGKRCSQPKRGIFKDPPVLLILALAASLLPDLDAVPGVLTGDFSRFHNNETHSLVTGLVVSLAAASILAWKWRTRLAVPGFAGLFSVILLSYELHVIMDFFTRGRGVMLLWPFSPERYSSPVILFTGVHWSEGLFSILHLWTLANELVFALIIFLLLYVWESRKAGREQPQQF